MRRSSLFVFPIILLAGCSETNLDDLDTDELQEIEQQVEEEAQSLEEAADEAVRVLEEEIQAELDDEGVGAPAATPPPAAAEEDSDQ